MPSESAPGRVSLEHVACRAQDCSRCRPCRAAGAATIAPLRLERIDDPAALAERADAWNTLAASLPQRLPLLTHAWIAPLLEQRVHPPASWFVLFAFEGDALRGVLPVVAGPAGFLGLRRPRLFVPCAYNINEGDAVLAPGHEGAVLDALLRGLLERVPRPSRLELGCIREGSPTLDALRAGVAGWVAARGPSNLASALVVKDGIEALRTRFSKSLERDMRRGRNRIKREYPDGVRIEFLEGADARPEMLEALIEIERTGWKGEEGGAIGSDPARRARYEAMARLFADAGALEWHLFRLGDRLAAAHMAIRFGRSLMLLRQAYDAELSKFGGGHLLLLAAAERECERGEVEEINLVNDYPWCRRWGMEQTRYDRFHLLRNRPWPLLTGGAPYLARAVGRRIPGLKKLLGRG